MRLEFFVADVFEFDSDPALDADVRRPVINLRRFLYEGLLQPGRRGNPDGDVSVVVMIVGDMAKMSGQSQPTLDAIRKLAVALSVSADLLLFEKDERGPDEELKLQFEAVANLDPEEKKVIRSVIESMLLRHEAKRWSGAG